MTQNNRANRLSEIATLPGKTGGAAAASPGRLRRRPAVQKTRGGAAGLRDDAEQPGQPAQRDRHAAGEDRRRGCCKPWPPTTTPCCTIDPRWRRWTTR
ncbi:MAG: hypothetical protein HZY76_14605 [Anaerolineae bacterium]|nr:MAG: hypothetical protein HZY76_14605 [Anaerolineae bacterium]